ncbi:MAG: hypothetical protein PHX38_03335 [Sulfuricella sp.]|nr:hypothetical protein [Sulfuricella sp.]
MTLASMASSVYLIFALINRLAFPPVPGAKYANYTAAIGKADGDNPTFDLADTEIAFFHFAVSEVFGDDTAGVGEGVLRQGKRDSMLFQVFGILVRIPLEPCFLHEI